MRSKERTRKQIIDTATEIFCAKGFDETTFSDISSKIGLSQPALYSHFKNKMDLLLNVSLNATEVARVYVKESIDPKAKAEVRLKTYLESHLIFFKKQKEYAYAIIAQYYFSSSSKVIHETFLFVQEKTIDQIETLLIQGLHEKVFNFEDTRVMARIIHSLMVGECYKMLFSKSEKKSKLILISYWESVQQLLKLKS